MVPVFKNNQHIHHAESHLVARHGGLLRPRHQLPLVLPTVPAVQPCPGQTGVQQADLHHGLLHGLQPESEHRRPQPRGGPSVPVPQLPRQLSRRSDLHVQLRARCWSPAGLLLQRRGPHRHLQPGCSLHRRLSQVQYSTVQYSTVQETISGSMTRPECSDSRGPGTASLTAQPSPTPPTSRSSSRRTMTAPRGKVTMQNRVSDHRNNI